VAGGSRKVMSQRQAWRGARRYPGGEWYKCSTCDEMSWISIERDSRATPICMLSLLKEQRSARSI